MNSLTRISCSTLFALVFPFFSDHSEAQVEWISSTHHYQWSAANCFSAEDCRAEALRWKESIDPALNASGCEAHELPAIIEWESGIYHHGGNGGEWRRDYRTACSHGGNEDLARWKYEEDDCGVEGGTFQCEDEYVLEEPIDCGGCSDIPNESNPINPADGNKFQREVDYSAPNIGLSFVRYHNTLGDHRTASDMAVGWRHSYSAVLDEAPDTRGKVRFQSTAGQSQIYSTAENACESGFSDIDDSPLLSQNTHQATFVEGNICRIEEMQGSSGYQPLAFFPIRSISGGAGFVDADAVRTVTRPSGRTYYFEQQAGQPSVYLSELDPSVSLHASGSDWIFTDQNDTQETFNSSGQLTLITKRNGQHTTLVYDLAVAQGGDGNSSTLDKVTGPFGHELIFEHSGGFLEKVITPDGDVQIVRSSDDQLEKVIYPDLSERRYVYEDLRVPHHLTGIIDEESNRYATWEYDDDGKGKTSYRGTDKEKVAFTYNLDGTTDLVIGDDAQGNNSARTYNMVLQQNRRVLSLLSGSSCGTCAAGTIADRSYDAEGFVYETGDWNGNLTRTARNSEGLVETLTEAVGSNVERVTATTWLSGYRLPDVVTSPLGKTTDYDYFPNGDLQKVTISDGTNSRIWDFTYNANGQITTVDGPRTDVTDVTTIDYYDCVTGNECGQVEKITDAAQNETIFDEYDSSGRVTKFTDANGLVTAYVYDTRGNITSVTQTPTSGTSRVTTMTYFANNRIETFTLPSGAVYTYTYYTDNQYLESVEDNLGNRMEYIYDDMGNLVNERYEETGNTLSRVVDYSFDLNNQIDSVTKHADSSNNENFESDLAKDLVGNLVSAKDANNNETQYFYDALNRLDDILNAASGVADFVYDDHDNLKTFVAANNAQTTFDYDGLDNLIKETSPDRGVTDYGHDDAGNITLRTDARGVSANYQYDSLNRLGLIDYPGTALDVEYVYDGAAGNSSGRLSQMHDETGGTNFEYTQFGELHRQIQSIDGVGANPEVMEVTYLYHDDGMVHKTTYPNGAEIEYVQDTIGRVSSVIYDFDGNTTTLVNNIDYEPYGPMNAWSYNNGLTQSINYDEQWMPESITVGAIHDASYVFDSGGVNIDQIVDNISAGADWSQIYDYDSLNRVIEDDVASGFREYDYDENGNRNWVKNDLGQYLQINTYDTNSNRINARNGTYSMVLDAAGNTTDDGNNNLTFDYDDRGRMVRSYSNGVAVEDYKYDGLNRRVVKISHPGQTNEYTRIFSYGKNGELLQESLFAAAGHRVDYIYVWLNSAPIAMIRTRYGSTGNLWDEVISYIHPDHLGTPRFATRATNSDIVWRWQSDAFGKGADESDPDGDGAHVNIMLRFPGQYSDGLTGKFYNHFRYYDPTLGRYMESDPIGLGGGPNLFLYGFANPLSFVDPFGLDPFALEWVMCKMAGGPEANCDGKMEQAIVEEVKKMPEGLADAGVDLAVNQVAKPVAWCTLCVLECTFTTVVGETPEEIIATVAKEKAKKNTSWVITGVVSEKAARALMKKIDIAEFPGQAYAFVTCRCKVSFLD